jgi:hypothetical protein
MKLHRRLLRRLLPPRTLDRINHLWHLDERLIELEARRAQLAEVVLRDRYTELFATAPGPEFGIFSQNGEDGILLWLLEETGAPLKTFVEIGIQDARECNTALLGCVLGWDGLMVDADPRSVAGARAQVGRTLRCRPNRVEVRQALVTRDNVNALIGEGELGVLSIDVDGMDYWLWKAADRVQPRIVIVEYNASLGPEASITVPYQPDFFYLKAHASGYYHGASLAALEKLGREKGYTLVAVCSAGVNAFFLQDSIRPATLPARNARELFRPHLVRQRLHSQEEQWALIRPLPYERV